MKKLFCLILISVSILSFSQEKRLALVIGNSAYEHAGILRNPVNDAMAMKKALSQVGFVVIEKFNLDQGGMKRAIDDFGLELKGYDVGLFFYAGHGIQANGNNYLIPVDANLTSENDVEYECIDAGRVLGKMEDADNGTNIVVLDACRNNPFERSWTRSAQGRGLASMDAPIGSILAYATAPGTTASDGTGNNGLYTSAFVKNITLPGLSIEDVFKQVRINVVQSSNGLQTPWESTSLMGDFFFLSRKKISNENSDINEPQTSLIVNNLETDIEGSFVDSRDGKEYGWVRIGQQNWMSENIKYFTSEGSGYPSDHREYGNIIGLEYTWDAAQNACPEGWHLPTDEEWKQLEHFLGMSLIECDKMGRRGTDQGSKLKAIPPRNEDSEKWDDYKGTNISGFSALARIIFTDDVGHLYTYNGIAYWTASEISSTEAMARFLDPTDPLIYRVSRQNKPFSKLFVRCIRD